MLNHMRFEVGVNLFVYLLLMADAIALYMVVDVKTIEADVISNFIFHFIGWCYCQCIVGREDQNLRRAIKQALYIRVNNPSLNRNIGKYHLPHIWDEVLFNISELKLK